MWGKKKQEGHRFEPIYLPLIFGTFCHTRRDHSKSKLGGEIGIENRIFWGLCILLLDPKIGLGKIEAIVIHRSLAVISSPQLLLFERN
jgi:hypothetical protein